MQISNFKISTVNGLRRVIVLAVGGARFKVFKFLGLGASNARVWVVAAKGSKFDVFCAQGLHFQNFWGSAMQISNFKISTVNGLRRVIVLAVGGARFQVFKFWGLEERHI